MSDGIRLRPFRHTQAVVMLEYLHLKNVGPAPEMAMDLAPRLNLITGDNGLGKSFLLDIAWWALTRTWAGLPALPRSPGQATGSIGFSFEGKVKSNRYISNFDRKTQSWTGRAGRPANPGLVLYAAVDGGFSVWDPARNYWRKKGNIDIQDRPAAYLFDPRSVWDGLAGKDRSTLCNGLIRDWASWQKEKGDPFKQLKASLASLSPPGADLLVPGDLTRISLDDVRDIPTLRMPYGQDVPIVHASAGVRRIVALAYLLVWAWNEHCKASELLGQQPTHQVIFLIDEVEAHLHPRWQRVIMRALLAVVEALTGTQAAVRVQIITATHSPLVLASIEPSFSSEDAWFDLDLAQGTQQDQWDVVLQNRPWVRRGDVSQWLTSEAFDLGSARSLEAEELLEKAARALSDPSFDTQAAMDLDTELRKVLGDTDPFWVRWRFVGEKRGWLS